MALDLKKTVKRAVRKKVKKPVKKTVEEKWNIIFKLLIKSKLK